MKKLLSLGLSLALVLGLATTAFAAGETFTGLNDTTYTVSEVLGKETYTGTTVYKVPVGTTITAKRYHDKCDKPRADFSPAKLNEFSADEIYFITDDANQSARYSVNGSAGDAFTFTADKPGKWCVYLYDKVEGFDYPFGSIDLEVVDSAAPTDPVPTPDPEPEEKPAIPATGTAYTMKQTAVLDGAEVAFDTYALKDANGNGTNYMKIRDLAYVLNGSSAQFNVASVPGGIRFDSKTAYAPNGTEMSVPFTGDQTYSVTPGTFLVDGEEVSMTTISLLDANGNGYTYIKVRDLAEALDFYVGWEGKIVIDTNRPYEA